MADKPDPKKEAQLAKSRKDRVTGAKIQKLAPAPDPKKP